jgi:xanthine dehydrogenase accessory factor
MELIPPSENKPVSNLIVENISRILQEGSLAVLATLIAGETGVGSKLLVGAAGSPDEITGTLGIDALDAAVQQRAAIFLESRENTHVFQVKEFAPALSAWSDAQILFERIQREPRLVVCGAGHVGASLAELGSRMGYRVTLIDDRAEFLSRERFPDELIALIAAQDWTDAVRESVGNGHGVSVAVVTRGHSEDEQCMRALMESDADYVGLIGSKRRTNIVLQRLRESGAEEKKLEKVHAPIGLDIGAVTPEEVALAIMAEIVAVRRGGKGGPLSERKGRTGK